MGYLIKFYYFLGVIFPHILYMVGGLFMSIHSFLYVTIPYLAKRDIVPSKLADHSAGLARERFWAVAGEARAGGQTGDGGGEGHQ